MFLVVLGLLAGAVSWWLGSRGEATLPGRAQSSGSGSSNTASVSDRDVAHAGAGGDGREAVAPTGVQVGRLLMSAQPLVGVEVIACQGPSWQAVALHRVVTGDDGTFELPKQSKSFWLPADGPRVPRHWKTSPLTSWTGSADFEVPAPGSIEGFVRNRIGAPVAGAKVTRLGSSYTRVYFASPVEVETVTDKRGWFRFDRVGKDDGRLHCEADNYAIVPEQLVAIGMGEDVTTEIVLDIGKTLRGLVMGHRGDALPGAAVVSNVGRKAVTDALGQFSIEHFGLGDSLTVTAKGHLEHEEKYIYSAKKQLRIKLDRAVTLTGNVIGSKGKPGMVYVDYAPNERPDASKRLSYGAVYSWLDIVRDGKFELSGLAMSDFQVTVRIPGVGAVGPVRVDMRDDVELDFTIVPQDELIVSVLDRHGQPVVGATLVRDDGILAYASLYRGKPAAVAHRIRHSRKHLPPVAADKGDVVLGVPQNEAVAFFVEAPGYLPVARALMADAMPERVAIVLEQAGRVRGVVIGGSRKDYDTTVAIEAVTQGLEATAKEQPAPNVYAATTRVDADGKFAVEKLRPGSYRALLSRRNTATTGEGASGVPLIDADVDYRMPQEFAVVAGEETCIELRDPPLGRLTGRVLLHGRPIAGAIIVARRPRPKKAGKREQPMLQVLWSMDEWDSGFMLPFAPGQHSKAGGEFVFLYRDAGPVELFVHNDKAAVTSVPVPIDLPAPGDDVARDVEIPAGEIRGRYPIELLTESEQKSFTVTLYPMHMTLHDPHYSTDYSSSLSSACPSVEKSKQGRFAFSFLGPGKWLVRVHASTTKGGRILVWQKVLDVRGDVVDVGELPLAKPVQAPLRWQWQGKRPGQVNGVWLRVARPGGGEAIWAATVVARGATGNAHVMPGSYLAIPFGYFGPDGQWPGLDMFGVSGEELGKPVPIEIRSDGSVLPKIITFSPRPEPKPGAENK